MLFLMSDELAYALSEYALQSGIKNHSEIVRRALAIDLSTRLNRRISYDVPRRGGYRRDGKDGE